MNKPKRHIALALTGASGAQYGLRLLECLLKADIHVYLMLSKPAQLVIGMETDWKLTGKPQEIKKTLVERLSVDGANLEVFGESQWTAAVASGSSKWESYVVCPCTTGTLAAIASGQSRSLIERTADVAIKERRNTILVVRETPFSSIHLENMLSLTRAGVTIMPANPGFYHRPATVDDLVDFMVARLLDHLQVEQTLLEPWGQ